MFATKLGEKMAHFVGIGIQNDLLSHPGIGIDGHRAFQVYGAVSHGLFHHAQHIKAEFLVVLYAQSAQLLGL